jgi:hypothetical protein
MTEIPLARKMSRTLEPYHSMAYFTSCTAAFEELGLDRRAFYFASRSAGLGAGPAEVVTATFFGFHPDEVRTCLAAAWAVTTPEAVAAARLRMADEALRSMLGDEVVDDHDIVEAAGLARVAADAAEVAGRPLFAAHAALAWPGEPHLALWHALTLLREHRGDGHIAALVVAGFDPCEALVVDGARPEALFSGAALKASRGWSDDEWAAAVDRLRRRGLLDDTGALTAEGAALREDVEARTDEAASGPWLALGTERADRLRALVRPFSRRIVASGVFANPLP